MKILVTGGAGFIGSHVVDAFVARGDRVSVLDDLSSGARENLPIEAVLTVGDVADEHLVHSLIKEVDAVVHLAAIASVEICESEPTRATRTNVNGTHAVFEAAAARAIPVVYASSAAVYGDNPNLPLTEDANPQPLGNYGRHKLENEAIAQRHAKHAPSVGLRFFNVYGPRQDPRSPYSGVISRFAAQAQTGQAFSLFGDGMQTRDFFHVSDAVALVLRALDHPPNNADVINGCSGVATSLLTLCETLSIIVGSTPRFEKHAARVGDIRHSLGAPEKAVKNYQFRASMPLDKGLRTLLAPSTQRAHA